MYFHTVPLANRCRVMNEPAIHSVYTLRHRYTVQRNNVSSLVLPVTYLPVSIQLTLYTAGECTPLSNSCVLYVYVV